MLLANAIADGKIAVIDLKGIPLTPCSPQKAAQNVADGLAVWAKEGVLRLNYQPLAYRRIYRQIQRRDGRRCGWCRESGTTLDHVIPLCRGGQTIPENCVIACRACNHSRNNALPSAFLRWTGFKPIHPVIRHIVAHEEEMLRLAEETLGSRPLSSCVSREEAQVWIAYHSNPLERVRPNPLEEPFTKIKADSRAFSQFFTP